MWFVRNINLIESWPLLADWSTLIILSMVLECDSQADRWGLLKYIAMIFQPLWFPFWSINLALFSFYEMGKLRFFFSFSGTHTSCASFLTHLKVRYKHWVSLSNISPIWFFFYYIYKIHFNQSFSLCLSHTQHSIPRWSHESYRVCSYILLATKDGVLGFYIRKQMGKTICASFFTLKYQCVFLI